VGCNPNLIRVQKISFTASHCYTLEFNDIFQSGYQILQAAFDSEVPSQGGGVCNNIDDVQNETQSDSDVIKIKKNRRPRNANSTM